jgi:hypothetical protein
VRSSQSSSGATSVRQGSASTGATNGVVAPANPSSQFATRLRGATAGVVASRGQAVFASSVAPKVKAAPSTASPSVRSAAADVWSGVGGSKDSASLSAANAGGSASGGLGASLGIGLGILGFGLVGLAGTALVASSRRRRAESRSEDESR